ncbi:MAG: hypothetical protein AB7S71_01400 [Dongiaceae bacterium]
MAKVNSNWAFNFATAIATQLLGTARYQAVWKSRPACLKAHQSRYFMTRREGEGRLRPRFKTGAFNRSATHPDWEHQWDYSHAPTGTCGTLPPDCDPTVITMPGARPVYASSLPFHLRPCFDRRMAIHTRILPTAACFWLAWNETAFHACITVALRSSKLTTDYWMRAALPANEYCKMIVEKQIAAIEAVAAAWKALPTNDPVRIGTAVLGPYRRRTRANARRLSRSARQKRIVSR